jgi:hypothetical protein
MRKIAQLTPSSLAAMSESSLEIIGRYSPAAFGREVARIAAAEQLP